jgi:hypothetical protein
MSAAVETWARLPPAESGPCRDCTSPATRTLGRHPFCDDCADELLAVIRAGIVARDGGGVGVRHGRAHRELGPRMWLVACTVCQATWVDVHGAPCPWCVERLDLQHDEQRQALLHPPWAEDAGPVYDELSRVDRAVWDRTRGIDRGEGSRRAWAERLGRAVQAGLICAAEARAALHRVRRTP